MKKLFLFLLVLGLIFTGVAGCAQQTPAAETPAAEVPTSPAEPADTPAAPAETAEAAPEAAVMKHVDLEALHGLYPADSVYAVIGEREITWGEYYEWLGTYVLSGENYMETMVSYGMNAGWDSEYAAGVTFADYVTANLEDNLRAFAGIDAFAAEKGVTVSEEDLAAKKAEDMSAMLGAEATEEDWAALLVSNFMTENVYRAQAKANLQLRGVMDACYGQNGEKLSTAALQHYIEDKGYLRCNHILLLTMDMESREALDAETIAAKKSQAEEIAAELQAIENREELLARFAELKEELDEDSGKVYYPDGYIFTPGSMVAAFEETTQALTDYEVSAPVLSEYGYHVIIRLPIDADTTLDDGSKIGAAAASEIMAADLDEVVDALEFTYAPGAEPVNLLDFVVEEADK